MSHWHPFSSRNGSLAAISAKSSSNSRASSSSSTVTGDVAFEEAHAPFRSAFKVSGRSLMQRKLRPSERLRPPANAAKSPSPALKFAETVGRVYMAYILGFLRSLWDVALAAYDIV